MAYIDTDLKIHVYPWHIGNLVNVNTQINNEERPTITKKRTIPSNYWLIRCLPVIWKILTTQINEEIYYLLKIWEIFSEVHKRRRKGTKGTDDVLYIDQQICIHDIDRLQNRLWYGLAHLDNRISENVQNIQQIHKLHDESHERLEGGIYCWRTKSSRSENRKRQRSVDPDTKKRNILPRRAITENIEWTNQESFRTLAENENDSYLGLLEMNRMKQAEMKKKRKRIPRKNKKISWNQALRPNFHQRDKHQGNPPSNVLRIILEMEKGEIYQKKGKLRTMWKVSHPKHDAK